MAHDEEEAPPFMYAVEEHDLSLIPDPNETGNMTDEVLPHDWEPDHGDR